MKRPLSMLTAFAALVALAACRDVTAPAERRMAPSERPSRTLTGEGSDDFKKALDECLHKFAADGDDAKRILHDLQKSSKAHKVVSTTGAPGTSYADPKDATASGVPVDGANTSSGTGTGKGTAATVKWDPTAKITDDSPDGKPADPCTVLLHELRHALDAENGTRDPRPEKGSGVKQNEIDAVTSENKYRQSQGQPQRTTYGGKKLPDSVISK